MEYPLVFNMTANGTWSSLFYRHPALTASYAVIVALVSVVGTLGNLLIIGTLVSAGCRDQAVGGGGRVRAGGGGRRRRSVGAHRVTGDVFILNLACSDLAVTALINPFAIIGVVRGADFFLPFPGLCQVLASVCVISCIGSLLSILCISVNRYIYICHQKVYDKVFSDGKSFLMVCVVWLVAVVIDLPSYAGWTQKTFDQKSHKCLWDRRKSHSYTLYLVLGGMALPLTVMSVFYARIFIYMGKAKKKLQEFSYCHGLFFKLMRQARMMVVIFGAFAVCWAPYILVLVIDKDDQFPLWIHLVASLVAHAHASVNCFIYGVANRDLREGYRRFLVERVFCCLGLTRNCGSVTRSKEALGDSDVMTGLTHESREERAVNILLKSEV